MNQYQRGLWISVGSLLLLGVIYGGSHVSLGQTARKARLHLSWRMAEKVTGSSMDQNSSTMRDTISASHMQMPTSLRMKHMVAYQLTMIIDEQVTQQRFEPQGIHHDRPIYVEQASDLSPGPHHLQLSFVPCDSVSGARSYALDENFSVGAGDIAVVDINDNHQLQLLLPR